MYDDQKQETPSTQYEVYRIRTEERSAMYTEQPDHNKSGKQGSHVVGKFMRTIALAVVFGLVAGTVFHFTDGFWGEIFPEEQNTANNSSLQNTTVIESEKEKTASSDTAEAEDGEEETALSEVSLSDKGVVAQVASASMPSVVAITTVSVQEIRSFFGYSQQYRSAGSGSGIIVGENEEELFIATNNHVIENAETLSVCFIGDDVAGAEKQVTSTSYGSSWDVDVDSAVSGSVKGTDEENDLAIVSVKKADIPGETLSQIKIASLGDSDDLVVGEQVVAIGNALGYGQSVTSGYISALDRTVTTQDGTTTTLLQTDAAINPGNSGGALLNMKGELIGINSAKYADENVEGMGYAIPISRAYPILEELMNRETREKVDDSEAGYLGVSVADISREAMRMYSMPSGAFVTDTFEESPAALYGIQKGDIIVKFDGQTVSGRDSLIETLGYYYAGETVDMIVARSENGVYLEQTIQVTLGSRNG